MPLAAVLPPPDPCAPVAVKAEGRVSDSGGSSRGEPERQTFVLSGDWPAGASARAYEWRVPAGWSRGEYSGRVNHVIIEGVPLAANGTDAIHSWGLLEFHLNEGKARLVSTVLAPTLETASMNVGTRALSEAAPSMKAFYASTMKPPYDPSYGVPGASNEADVQDGDRIGFLLLLDTERPIRFGIGFANAPLDAWDPQGASLDPATIDPAGCSTQVIAGHPLGNGFSIAFAAREFGTIYIPGGATGRDVRTKNVERSEALPQTLDPYVRTNDVSLKTRHEAAAGWSLGAAYYYSYHQAALWSIDAKIRNLTLQYTGAVVAPALYGGAFYQVLFGVPGYDIVAEGPGASRSSYRYAGHSAELLGAQAFFQLDVDASLQDAFGMPALTFARIHKGLAGSLPPGGWIASAPGMVQLGSEDGETYTVLTS